MSHLRLEDLGGRALTDDERAHAQGCPTCRDELACRDLHRTALSQPPPAALSALIQQRARFELARSGRPIPWTRPWAWAALLSLAAFGTAALLLGLRPDWGTLGSMAQAGNIAALLCSFAAASLAAFAPGLGLRWRGPLATLALAVVVALALPGARAEAPPAPGAVPCIIGLALWSAVPLAVSLAALRRSAELSRGRGLLAALGSGALGMLVLFLRCPGSEPGHILGSHLVGWMLLWVLGALLGDRLRPRLWVPLERRPEAM